ncbi:sporulation histidine kinase inhibitor Sda [Halalkalibacter wakoensis]|nr:sporulation histidine kinase inhibitor Sda [Halalkalibacter wakoensis]
MHQLDDRLLVETFKKAKRLNLNDDFIKLLEDELIKRKLLDQVYVSR